MEKGQSQPNQQMQQQMQQLYMEYQMLDQAIKQMEKQVGMVEAQAGELQQMVANLEEFKALKKGKDMLVQVTPGMFAKAASGDPNELIVNVGAGIAVTKDVNEAKAFLEKQLADMQQIHVQLSQEIRNQVSRAAQLEQQLGMMRQ